MSNLPLIHIAILVLTKSVISSTFHTLFLNTDLFQHVQTVHTTARNDANQHFLSKFLNVKLSQNANRAFRVEGRTQFKSHQETTSSHTLLATLHSRSKWFGVSSVLKLQRGHISLFLVPLLTSTDFEAMHPWVAIHTKSSTLGGHIFPNSKQLFVLGEPLIFPSSHLEYADLTEKRGPYSISIVDSLHENLVAELHSKVGPKY